MVFHQRSGETGETSEDGMQDLICGYLGEKLTGIQVMAMFDRQNDGISWSTMGLLASFKTEHGQLMPILWVQNSTPFLTQASTYMLPVIEE